MLNKQKNLLNNSKFFTFLLLTSLLIPIPFIKTNEARAGLEIQWDGNPYYKKLRWFQISSAASARNKIFFFLRPFDRKADLLKINMKIPKSFKSTLKEEKISLCQVKLGGLSSRTKCIKNIPADIEIKIAMRLFSKYSTLKKQVYINSILMDNNLLTKFPFQVI